MEYTNGRSFAESYAFAREHRAALVAERVRDGFRLAGFAVGGGRVSGRSLELGYRVVAAFEADDEAARKAAREARTSASLLGFVGGALPAGYVFAEDGAVVPA